MTSNPVRIMVNTSLRLMAVTTSTATDTNQSDHHSTAGSRNWTVPDGCMMVRFHEMDLSYWNNARGIVSAEERVFVQTMRDYAQILFFLIGVPTNVINMAVFYKQGLKDRVMLCLFFLAFTDGMYLTLLTVSQAEELYNLFSSIEGTGRFLMTVINNNWLVLVGIFYASPVLSAIIAVERCLCVFNPLRFQTLVRTRTMAVIIVGVYASVYACSFGLYVRYRLECFYDPILDVRILAGLPGEFYQANKEFVDFMESIVLSVGVLGGSMIVVMMTTMLTIMKLRHFMQWRSEASSSISSRDVALTKMLVANSILFAICVLPNSVFNFVRLFFPEVAYGQFEHNLYLCGAWIGDVCLLIRPCVNIFVYYTMGSRYRETFWAVFRRKGKKQLS